MKKIFYLSNLILFLITLLSCENSDNLSEKKSNNNALSTLSAKKNTISTLQIGIGMNGEDLAKAVMAGDCVILETVGHVVLMKV